MRRTLPFSLLMTTSFAFLLAGCTGSGGEGTSASPTSVDATTSLSADPGVIHDSGLPHNQMPEIAAGKESWEDCPYLDADWVAETNGQRVIGVGVDKRFNTPACIFWSYPEEPQLTVLVRTFDDPVRAIEAVDWAAPIDTTEPAEEPEGWSGGRAGGSDGALYAVQRNGVAVIVFSNQEQSLKPQLVAEEVIRTLAL